MRLLAVGAATAAALAGSAATPAGAAATPHAALRIDMRVLLLADDGADETIVGWQDNLRREGVPFDVITGATTLTAATFADGDRAKYQAVVVSGPGRHGGRDPVAVQRGRVRAAACVRAKVRRPPA